MGEARKSRTAVLAEPRSNRLPGPLPAQGDWTDPRWQPRQPGNRSATIPFQRPAWASARDWDSWRHAVERGSSYSVVYPVRPTMQSLLRYLLHLEQLRRDSVELEAWKIEEAELRMIEGRCRQIRQKAQRRAGREQANFGTTIEWVRVEEVVLGPEASRATRDMVEAGKIPGLRWDPARGVVRASMVQRRVDVAAGAAA